MVMILWLWIMKLEHWGCCEVWGSHNSEYKLLGCDTVYFVQKLLEQWQFKAVVFTNRFDWSKFQTCNQSFYCWIGSKKTNKSNEPRPMLTRIYNWDKSASFLHGSPAGKKTMKTRHYKTLRTRNIICDCV